MTSKRHSYWVLSNFDGIGHQRSENARWGLDVKITRELDYALKWKEGPLDHPPLDLIGRADRPDRVEDVPFVFQGLYVISDRIRVLIEEAGPGDCQFLPVDIRFGRKSLGLPYWIMHANRVLDCANPETSYNVNKPGESPFYMRADILDERVPPSVATFRVRNGTPKAMMRDSLKRKIVRAKATGCMFYPP